MFTMGGGLEQQTVAFLPPPADNTLLWVAGVAVPVVLALIGWYLKK